MMGHSGCTEDGGGAWLPTTQTLTHGHTIQREADYMRRRGKRASYIATARTLIPLRVSTPSEKILEFDPWFSSFVLFFAFLCVRKCAEAWEGEKGRGWNVRIMLLATTRRTGEWD